MFSRKVMHLFLTRFSKRSPQIESYQKLIFYPPPPHNFQWLNYYIKQNTPSKAISSVKRLEYFQTFTYPECQLLHNNPPKKNVSRYFVKILIKTISFSISYCICFSPKSYVPNASSSLHFVSLFWCIYFSSNHVARKINYVFRYSQKTRYYKLLTASCILGYFKLDNFKLYTIRSSVFVQQV
jgi:hypothetical protein